ncbi:hypothetical protein D7Y27_26465 [Corallococcus sp. AB004]|uniref:hypothetical protein n=1 Tax=Corallococcus TaxID=83461 RepID=UPI000EA34D8A|nr:MULTISPECIES: hypothetical protein [Corallococcus]NPC72858.1 hypothetical protein [Corallococcus exiguus]NRD50389.1 hypothetical protein [Corallococcus exiguus]RKH93218.1 hypothetical protein D7Y04_41235 [Corallococcus sp. AB038B]RKI37110.1 hypothetical protein D7Y27_26465 [Corallococcus sp. AB004]
MAWTAPTLGLLLCAGPALASEPTVTKDGDQSGQMVANYTNPASSSPSNVPSTIPTLTPNIVAPGQAVRQINLDPNKMRQVSGPVVKRSGLILYVQDVTGPVVPLDMSNLTIYKPPLKGQQVLALYQVDETDNVALSLQGEKQD